MKEIFKSDRYFALFDYSVSHGQLLLRSDKRKGYETNIDVIFFDTQFIQLFTMLDDGITVKLIDKSSIKNYNKLDAYLSFDHNNLFEIESGDSKYYIASSFVRIFENKLEFNETSLGFSDDIRGIEISNSL